MNSDDLMIEIRDELQMLRKLKMVELIDNGYSQSKLATALGVSQSTISRLLSGKKTESKGA